MNLDTAIFLWLNSHAGHTPALDALMVALARYAPVIIAVVLLACWARWTRDWQRVAALAGAAALLALGAGQLVGLALPRLRPYQVLSATVLVPHAPDTSFPSDHAILVAAVTVVLLSRSRTLGAWLILFSLLVLVARVYIGVHYPSDVVGGAALGVLGALVTIRLARTASVTRMIDAAFALLVRLRLAAREAPAS